MNTLSTAFALLCLALNFLMLWSINADLRAARDLVQRLRGMGNQVNALEQALVSLTSQHRKLAGRVYQAQGREEPEPTATAEPCENWALAKLEGPQSKAARCECEYCTLQREQRRAVRKTIAPRNAQELAKFSEENA